MRKAYRKLGWALLVALIAGAWFYALVVAVEKTPPYVIAVQDTGEGSHPSGVATDPGGYGYVLDDLGKVWIFSGTEITAALPIGNSPHIGVAPGSYVYITSEVGDPIRILQGKAQVTTVDLGKPTGAVAVLTKTGYVEAYVVLPEDHAIAVLRDTGVHIASMSVGITPTAITVDPTTDWVYVANYGDDTVTIFDETLTKSTVPVGDKPAALAVNPVTGYVYVSNSGADTMSIIQGTSVVATVPVGVAPGEIAVNPNSGRVYVVNRGDPWDTGSLSVLSATQVISAEVPVGDYPKAIDVNPHSGYIYVVGGLGDIGTVSVLSDTLVVETFLPVGHSPRDVAVDPVSDLAYASLYKATGGQDLGQVVVLGRTEASRKVLDPDVIGVTRFDCEGVNGLPVTVLVPPDAVTESVTLLCAAWEPETQPKGIFAEQGFFLKAYQNGVHQPGFTFQQPITVSAVYPAVLPDEIDVTALELRVGASGADWTLDGITPVAHELAAQQITVTVGVLPEPAESGYAVLMPMRTIYLPLVLRNG